MKEDRATLAQEIANGETDTLEFKRDVPSEKLKILKTACAFANGNGGRIVIGVDDDVNAVVHRVYVNPQAMSVQVALYDDRLEVTSPGGLPHGMSLQMLETGRTAKNTVHCGDDTVATNSTALDHNSTVSSTVGRNDSTLQGDWTQRLPPALRRLVAVLSNETRGSQELCRRLNLKSRGALRQTYIQPAIKAGVIDVVGGKTHSSKRAYRVVCPVGCENDAVGRRGDGGRGATALPGKTTREDA